MVGKGMRLSPKLPLECAAGQLGQIFLSGLGNNRGRLVEGL